MICIAASPPALLHPWATYHFEEIGVYFVEQVDIRGRLEANPQPRHMLISTDILTQ
jgi:hypothetical protein